METFKKLSDKFRVDSKEQGSLSDLYKKVSTDLEEIMPQSNEVLIAHNDRGGQRALKWGTTVAKIQKSVIDRYIKKGETPFEGKNIYVCQACGFIFVGNELPEICAACKVPSNRFEKINQE
jgi:rubrerythrin